MLRTLLFKTHSDNTVEENIEHIDLWSPKSGHLLWLHIVGKDNKDTDKIRQQFSLDDLAIADSLRDRHPPKFESFKQFDFILFRPLAKDNKTNIVTFSQLSIFVGDGYVITRSFAPNAGLDEIWQQYSESQNQLSVTPTSIICSIGRAIAAQYLQQIYTLERELEEIENSLDNDIKDRYLTKLTQHIGLLRKMARNLEYMEGVARKLKDSPRLSYNNETQHKLVDFYDQIERGLSLSRMYQGLCNDLINAHISITSHRVNKVVKALTIATVLFLPLSFIAGLYGMNFENIPELKIKNGYFYALGLMLFIEIALVIVMRKIKWI